MAYANGIPYIDTSVTPNIGVSIYDVQRALGTSECDEGSLCTHDNINKWARYKPERADGQQPLTYGDAQIARSRKGNNFGLAVPYCHYDAQRVWYEYVLNGMVADVLAGNFDAWEYLKPRGIVNNIREFYRITDFVRLPTDQTDPLYGTNYAKGYNQQALVPFVSWLDMTGVTLRQDGIYEINKQVSTALTVLFQNSIGDELHLQDFITLGTDSYGRAWRPVLQVFADAREYDDTTGQYEDWDNRDFADMEACGNPITEDAGNTLWSVSLDINSIQANPNVLYHLCVGVGYVNSSFNSWGETGKSLFMIPYNPGETPFHYKFAVVSYSARKVRVTGLKFFQDGLNIWADATGTAPYFTINSLATNVIRIIFTITKNQTQALDFLPENGTPDSGYDPLKIQAREIISGGSETTRYLTPKNSSWQTPSEHIHVGTGQPSETQTLYAELNIGNIPTGEYGEYHLFAYTGGTDQQGNPQYDNVGYFSIHKIQY